MLYLRMRFAKRLNSITTVYVYARSIYSGEAYFSIECEFNDIMHFNYVLFEDGKKILFEKENLAKVSFMNTDITRVKLCRTSMIRIYLYGFIVTLHSLN